jgi:hypothetical protein
MILADSITPPPGFAYWMASLAFLMVMLNQGWKFVGNIRGKPSSMELRQEVHASFLPRGEFDTYRFSVENRLGELETDTENRDRTLRQELANLERRLNESSERRLDAFNARLLEQLKAIARMEGKLDQQS